MTSRLSLCLLLAAVGCNRTTQPTSSSDTERPRAESDLARTTLSAKSVKSLGIATTAARKRPVQETLRLTGLVVPRVGAEATVTAPVSGVVKPPADQHSANLYYEVVPGPADAFLREVMALDAVRWCGVRAPGMLAYLAHDQMLTAAVPLDEKRDECVVPISAVLYDA